MTTIYLLSFKREDKFLLIKMLYHVMYKQEKRPCGDDKLKKIYIL